MAKGGLGPFQAGGAFQYVIDFVNFGPTNATNVVLTDTLPADLVPTSATPSSGKLHDLGPDDHVHHRDAERTRRLRRAVFISGTVAATAAAGPVTNTATIASDTDDPDPASNSSSDSVDDRARSRT